MQVAIDKGIPIPLPTNVFRDSKWDWIKKMEIGDSFLIPEGQNHKSAMSEICIRCKIWGWGKFSRRKTDEGVRVWRVE